LLVSDLKSDASLPWGSAGGRLLYAVFISIHMTINQHQKVSVSSRTAHCSVVNEYGPCSIARDATTGRGRLDNASVFLDGERELVSSCVSRSGRLDPSLRCPAVVALTVTWWTKLGNLNCCIWSCYCSPFYVEICCCF
jgi:hypothetical protein